MKLKIIGLAISLAWRVLLESYYCHVVISLCWIVFWEGVSLSARHNASFKHICSPLSSCWRFFRVCSATLDFRSSWGVFRIGTGCVQSAYPVWVVNIYISMVSEIWLAERMALSHPIMLDEPETNRKVCLPCLTSALSSSSHRKQHSVEPWVTDHTGLVGHTGTHQSCFVPSVRVLIWNKSICAGV